MPDLRLGPRARLAYETLLARIQSGQWPPGAQLPSQVELAAQLGIAPMTLRGAIAHLEAAGLVSSEHGRGTFVREPLTRAVLVVDDEAAVRALLCAHVTRAGYRVLDADGPASGLRALESDSAIALVMSDLAMPTTMDGVEFIRMVRRRWPSLPVAAVTGYPEELAALHGTPECPVLVITKPFSRRQIGEAICLAFQLRLDQAPALSADLVPYDEPRPVRQPGAGDEPRAVLLADDDPQHRSRARLWINELGFEVEEATSGDEALQALQRRQFGHVFLDVRLPGGGPGLGSAISQAYPRTTVVVSTVHPEDVFPLNGMVTVLSKPFDQAGIRASLELQRVPVYP